MLRVLTYHRIAGPESTLCLDPTLISASPSDFERQVRYLADRFQVVTLSEVLHSVRTGASLPANAVLVTFDDAYSDFGTIAWPILKYYGLPATLFVPTAYPDHPHRLFWWDRLYRAIASTWRPYLEETPLGVMPLRTLDDRYAVLRCMRKHCKAIAHQEVLTLIDQLCSNLGTVSPGTNHVLNWDQLRRLAREGVTLAGHTRTHPLLTQISSEAARDEVVGSQRDLEHQIGMTFPVFCFPGGEHNNTVISILKQQGFKLAFTTEPGLNDLRTADPWRLRRINVTRRTSPLIFRFRLSGIGRQVDAWRHARRRAAR
jgi:peptidoglycan/xylan/chitin deacetylase (PgdA/CDA1 family)